MMLILAALAAVVAPAATAPRANRLQTGSQCFSITRADAAVGLTYQAVRATTVRGRPAWDIVVHQRMNNGSFDMRDHFVVDRTTLRPIVFDSQRFTDREARGWHRVVLRYDAGRIVGTKETKTGVTPIDVALDEPVWDGNLWGITFAALPLRTSGRYTLPFWQYDKGFGTFTVNVVGREQVDIPGGKTDAWIVEAGDNPSHLSRYTVGTARPMEIGYANGPFGQRLGGDCAGMGVSLDAGAADKPIANR